MIMWIVTNTGLISIVEDRTDSSMVYVRSRRESDLVEFIKDIDLNFEIMYTEEHDYDYRVHMSKTILAKVLAGLANKIDYDNFKNSIPKSDSALISFAHKVWTAGFTTLKASAVEYFNVLNSRRQNPN